MLFNIPLIWPSSIRSSHNWWRIRTMSHLCKIWVFVFSVLKNETADFSITSVYTYKKSWHYVPGSYNCDLWSSSICSTCVLLYVLSVRFRRTPWHLFLSKINASSLGARDPHLHMKHSGYNNRYESDALKAKVCMYVCPLLVPHLCAIETRHGKH